MKRFVCQLVGGLLFCTLASADTVHLRNGKVLDGRVLGERDGVYTVQEEASPQVLQVPKHAVTFVIYENPQEAQKRLGLDRAAQLGRSPDSTSATLLPAEDFGSAIVETVKDAEESIWITAYIIGGIVTGTIAEFYEVLKEKAAEGVEVVMICEFSNATRPSLRHATLNRVQELADVGITVLFIQEYKSMHKKMIVVDRRTVLLGSSNLTYAGTESSIEMNVRITSAPIVQRVVADFVRLRERAKTVDELK